MANYTLRALFTLKPASACVMKITHAKALRNENNAPLARTQRPHGVPTVERLSPLKHFSRTCNKKHCVQLVRYVDNGAFPPLVALVGHRGKHIIFVYLYLCMRA